MLKQFTMALVLTLALSLSGCGGGAGGEAGKDGANAGKDKQPGADGKPAKVEGSGHSKAPHPTEVALVPVDHAEYEAEIAKLKGDVVVVDCWAMWCTECLREFDHTTGLAEKFGDQGFRVVTLSFDDESDQATALGFLKKKDAKLLNMRVKTGSAEESFEAWNIPSGTLPHVKIYGRDGKVVKVFDAGDTTSGPSFTHEDLEAAVKEQLEKT